MCTRGQNLTDLPACIFKRVGNEIQYETTGIIPTINPAQIWHKPLVTYGISKLSKDVPLHYPEIIGINLAVERWRAEIPLEFRHVPISQNPDVTFAWIAAADDPILKTDPTSIMGYSGYPGTSLQGKLILNDTMDWSWMGDMGKWNFQNTLTHEFGHSIGMVHTPECASCVMYPVYNGNRELGADEIKMVTNAYGVRSWNSNMYIRLKNWLYLRSRRLF